VAPPPSSGDPSVRANPAAIPVESTTISNGHAGLNGAKGANGHFAPPRLNHILRSGGRVTVVVRNRPRGARVALLLQRRRGEFDYATVARALSRTDTLTIRTPSRWRGGRLLLRYEVPEAPGETSPWVYRTLSG
jgi:hypothetical protein